MPYLLQPGSEPALHDMHKTSKTQRLKGLGSDHKQPVDSGKGAMQQRKGSTMPQIMGKFKCSELARQSPVSDGPAHDLAAHQHKTGSTTPQIVKTRLHKKQLQPPLQHALTAY